LFADFERAIAPFTAEIDYAERIEESQQGHHHARLGAFRLDAIHLVSHRDMESLSRGIRTSE
jgi:hypothetical protein